MTYLFSFHYFIFKVVSVWTHKAQNCIIIVLFYPQCLVYCKSPQVCYATFTESCYYVWDLSLRGRWGGIWVKRLSLCSMAQTVIAYVGMDENAWARTTSIVWGLEGCQSRCCPLGPGFGIRIESGYEYRDIVPSRAPADPPDKRPRRERKKRTGKAILLQRMHSSVHPLCKSDGRSAFFPFGEPHSHISVRVISPFQQPFSRSFSYMPVHLCIPWLFDDNFPWRYLKVHCKCT